MTCNDSVPAVGVVADDSGPVNFWIRTGTELEVKLRMPWNAVMSRTYTVITAATRLGNREQRNGEQTAPFATKNRNPHADKDPHHRLIGHRHSRL